MISKIKNILIKVLPHINIILGIAFIIIIILDWFNPNMGFLVNKISIKLLIIFCIISIINGLTLIIKRR